DANLCNGNETCQAGVCTGGSGLNCDDSNPCTTDTCDGLGGCLHAAVTNGTACSDGNPCNGNETCQAGTCTAGPGPICNDNNPCTADSCDTLLGCRNVAVINGTPCSDGDACNGGETCQTGVCIPGTAPNCNDNNPCTADT